jgi:hypothetical protein
MFVFICKPFDFVYTVRVVKEGGTWVEIQATGNSKVSGKTGKVEDV